MDVGAVITGDPGTEAYVINSGTPENAVFDFIIPRGDPGGTGALEALATVYSAVQPSTDEGALIFNEAPLISGTAITHTPGSPDITIQLPGVYQATFHATASVDAGVAIPATVTAQLYLNGAAVPGAITRHTFSSTGEEATVSFSVPFRVDSVPANLTVVVNSSGFSFNDLNLTVVRLGDAT